MIRIKSARFKESVLVDGQSETSLHERESKKADMFYDRDYRYLIVIGTKGVRVGGTGRLVKQPAIVPAENIDYMIPFDLDFAELPDAVPEQPLSRAAQILAGDQGYKNAEPEPGKAQDPAKTAAATGVESAIGKPAKAPKRGKAAAPEKDPKA